MMLAHWWDAEHWQGDCVYFYTFLLLTFLLLFSPFFFLFPGLLALGHVVDSSNAKHIGGKEHVVLIKKRLSQAIYLFVWKLLLHFTDNMEKKHEMKQKNCHAINGEKKWPCSHLLIACLLWSKNDRFQKVNWWFAQTVVAIVVRNTHRVDSIDVSFGLQELWDVMDMMLAHWRDAEHWQGDCVWFFTFSLLIGLFLFSLFFLFSWLLPLGCSPDFLFTKVPKLLYSFNFARNVLM